MWIKWVSLSYLIILPKRSISKPPPPTLHSATTDWLWWSKLYSDPILNNHLQWVGLLTGAPASINTCTSSAKPALQASWSACQFPWEVTDAPAWSKTLTISTYLPVTAHISGDRPNLSTSSKDEPACKRIFTMSRWPVEAATWMGSFLRCSVY